jgi:hypothetical protein
LRAARHEPAVRFVCRELRETLHIHQECRFIGKIVLSPPLKAGDASLDILILN